MLSNPHARTHAQTHTQKQNPKENYILIAAIQSQNVNLDKTHNNNNDNGVVHPRLCDCFTS